jgi:hypothetical protein
MAESAKQKRKQKEKQQKSLPIKVISHGRRSLEWLPEVAESTRTARFFDCIAWRRCLGTSAGLFHSNKAPPVQTKQQ